jgi:hypothetical protein
MGQQGAGEDRRWTPVADDVFSPAVAAAERSISLFMRGPRGDLLYRRRDADTWGELCSFGVPLARVRGSQVPVPVDWPLAACSTGPDEIQLLARGAEGELLHGTLGGNEWDGFECVGVPAGLGGAPLGLASAPSVCSRVSGQMDVFAIGAAGALLHATWDPAGFSELESLGGIDLPNTSSGPISGHVSACSCGDRRMGVFARGPAGDLLLKWWNGSAWSAFASLGSPQEPDCLYPAVRRAASISSAPAACGGGATRLDVFARGPRGDLLHSWWDGQEWHVFESLGMPRSPTGAWIPFTGISLACAWEKFRLNVFARAADGKLYSASSNGSWHQARVSPDEGALAPKVIKGSDLCAS